MSNFAATSPRVGAHQRHLVASANVVSAPVKCRACHVPVTAIRSANHWNNHSTATIYFDGLAKANSHSPTVTRTGGIISCSSTYCHTGKYNSGTSTTPLWNDAALFDEAGTTVGACTKCHAMPPAGYLNHQQTPLSDSAAISTLYTSCGSCHNTLKNGATNVGNAFTDKATHIDGTVQVSMPCNGCHSYDTTDSWTTTYGVEGIGAHVKHIAYIKARYGVTLSPSTDQFGTGAAATVCGMCHSNSTGDHSMDQSVNVRNINFGDAAGRTARQFGPSTPFYEGTTGTSSSVNPKSCSNIDCHYLTSPIWSIY
jgi:hypothetical protein